MKQPRSTCPHCNVKLSAWQSPPESSWGCRVMLVCFNDECPYYLRGWKWMEEHYQVSASYRYRYDPKTDSSGPLPVWSSTALKDARVTDEEESPDE